MPPEDIHYTGAITIELALKRAKESNCGPDGGPVSIQEDHVPDSGGDVHAEATGRREEECAIQWLEHQSRVEVEARPGLVRISGWR